MTESERRSRAGAEARPAVGDRIRRLADELLAALVPPACVACHVALRDAGELVCPPCRRGLPWLRGPLCPRCALPVPCRPCPAGRAAFDAAWAPLRHSGTARRLVAALKFRRRLAVADLMAGQLAAGAPPGLLDGAMLVPVPPDPGRARRRGFDHADRLARALSARTGLPLARCLARAGSGRRQVGTPRRERLAAGGQVVARGPVPERAALVDDVHTTGATLDACARALRAAGAQHVTAITYTRALRR